MLGQEISAGMNAPLYMSLNIETRIDDKSYWVPHLVESVGRARRLQLLACVNELDLVDGDEETIGRLRWGKKQLTGDLEVFIQKRTHKRHNDTNYISILEPCWLWEHLCSCALGVFNAF